MSITSTDSPATRPDAETPDAPERSVLSTTRGKVAAAFLAVALLGTGGFALTHLGGDSSTSASNVAAGGPGGGAGPGGTGPGGAGRGGANGSFTPPTQGTISAASASSITVKTSSGTQTYKITSSTEVQNDGSTADAADLTVGEKVVVFTGTGPNSSSSASTGTSAGTSADTATRIMAGSSATTGPGTGTTS